MREDEELLGTGITSFHIKCLIYFCIGGFPGGSVGKESARNVETWVQSLGWEDPLEKEMANHSSFLAWRISWAEATVGHD